MNAKAPPDSLTPLDELRPTRSSSALLLGVVVLVCWATCQRPSSAATPSAAPAPRSAGREPAVIVERIYDKGMVEPWQDHGWSEHELGGPGPARVKFNNHGGWIMAHTSGALSDERFGAVTFALKAPAEWGPFLEMRLEGDGPGFEVVRLGPEHQRALPDGWVEVVVPLRDLNPFGGSFRTIRLRAHRQVPEAWVLLDRVGLTGPLKGAVATRAFPERDAPMVIQCDRPSRPISPLIYGLADDRAAPELRASAYRLGGNRMSRYHWQSGAVNTGLDWYFRNVKHHETHLEFIERTQARKAYSALTIPIIGWVAKDTTSYSFPVSTYGPQRGAAPENADIGNGVDPAGKELAPGPPTRTSVPAPPEMMGQWVKAIRGLEAQRGTTLVHEYILDNEPGLWNSTHRDVHPEPMTYDELLDRTVRYATAIRAEAPDAIISGPAEWGWTGYFWSAKDAAFGFRLAPDRRLHGDVPLIEWYLKKLADHEKKTGVRLLDVVDLHFYPQGKGIFEGATDADTVARRLRAPRALWDPRYVDESWINEPVRLIPRLKEIIARTYPGRGLSIGEWNFGAESHVSGGLATAETLGRFAEGGVRSAFYWTAPKEGSAAYWGFRAFRNYDGRGGRFLDHYVESLSADGTSLFVSRDANASRLVAIALNLDGTSSARVAIDASTCGSLAGTTVYQWSSRTKGFEPSAAKGAGVAATLEPHSIAVFEVTLAARDGGNPGRPP